MNGQLRLLIGFGAIGAVSGTTYLIHQQLSTENIEKKLKANGYEILSHDKESIWSQILTNYKERIEAGKIDLKFDDFDGKTPEENPEKILKEKCKNVLKKSIDESYKKTEKWCTVPKKLTELLKNKGQKVLSTSSTDDEKDKDDWNNVIAKHNKTNENVEKRFSGLANDNAGQLKEDEKSRKEIKAECQKLLDRFSYDKDFEAILEKAEFWCIRKIKET